MLPNCGNIYKYLEQCGYNPNGGNFFTVLRALTYGRPWIFITGPRSAGKTTGTACFLLLDSIINGRAFLYTRRHKDDLELTKKNFFSDAITVINEKTDIKISEFFEQGLSYFIRLEGEEEPRECGKCFYISKEEKIKSGGYHIYNIVYDEFISQDSTGYLGTLQAPREYEKVLELYVSMDRGVGKPYRNEVRFFFLGNTATIYNPIFTELEMTQYIYDTSKIIAPKGKAWMLQQLSIDDVKALDGYKDSYSYMLSSQSQRDYNFNNRGRDNKNFIEVVPTGCNAFMNLAILGKQYGVYINNGVIYMGRPQNARAIPTLALDVDSHNGATREFILNYGSNAELRMIVKAFTDGRLRFSSMDVKMVFMKYFRFLPN